MCSLPYVTKHPSQKNIFVYIPGTSRVKVEEMEHEQQNINVAGCEIIIRKPIVTNIVESIKSLWTRRYMERRVITFAKTTVVTTDETLKYVSSVIGGAKFEKPAHLVD